MTQISSATNFFSNCYFKYSYIPSYLRMHSLPFQFLLRFFLLPRGILLTDLQGTWWLAIFIGITLSTVCSTHAKAPIPFSKQSLLHSNGCSSFHQQGFYGSPTITKRSFSYTVLFFLSNINHTDCHHSLSDLSYSAEVLHIPLTLSNLYLGKSCYHSVPGGSW